MAEDPLAKGPLAQISSERGVHMANGTKNRERVVSHVQTRRGWVRDCYDMQNMFMMRGVNYFGCVIPARDNNDGKI